ncbi:MAG: hypothetical protein XXXJIFNMEKO3_03166 [Candidatus Erwinia impunctatus]|nr:hypothetical protein XXXJIFNMEKO_03166 [Culicoides impunctatus]
MGVMRGKINLWLSGHFIFLILPSMTAESANGLPYFTYPTGAVMWYLLAASVALLPFRLKSACVLLLITLFWAFWQQTLGLAGLALLFITMLIAVYRFSQPHRVGSQHSVMCYYS